MKNQIKTFNQFINESRRHSEVQESLFGPSEKDLELRKMDLIRKIDDALEEEGLTDADLYNSVESVIRQAEQHDYDGKISIEQGRTGRIVMLFKPTPSKFYKSSFYKNFAEPLTQGMRKFQPKMY